MKLTYQEHTTCPSCGYTYSELHFQYTDVKFFLSGKNKGQVKSHKVGGTTLTSGIPFNELRNSLLSGSRSGFDVIDETGSSSLNTILICPGCSVVFLKKDNQPNSPKFTQTYRS